MTDCEILHDDIEERLKRFHSTEQLPEYEENLFDSTAVLYEFADSIKNKEIAMCKRQAVCKCAKPCPCIGKGQCVCHAKKKIRCKCFNLSECKCPVNCICDDDDFIDLKLIKAEALSNCRFLFEFQGNGTITPHKTKEFLRGFLIEDDREETIFELKNTSFKIYTLKNEVLFELDEPFSFKFKTLIINFDYMRYT